MDREKKPRKKEKSKEELDKEFKEAMERSQTKAEKKMNVYEKIHFRIKDFKDLSLAISVRDYLTKFPEELWHILPRLEKEWKEFCGSLYAMYQKNMQVHKNLEFQRKHGLPLNAFMTPCELKEVKRELEIKERIKKLEEDEIKRSLQNIRDGWRDQGYKNEEDEGEVK